MAEAAKPSFLGAISPWSRNTSPQPSPRQQPQREDTLKQSTGEDHAISVRPTPSLNRYPKDCPQLNSRWYYAVDVAKRKAFASAVEDKSKPAAVPKKWVLFSASDSQAIESAFLSLDRGEKPIDDTKPTSTKVPVNEDYLYDVHIEKRELEPAYWIGPVYDVRRGSWFYSEGSILRPCDENLANQLEEGYLRVTPWRQKGHARSASQGRTKPSSTVIAGIMNDLKSGDTTGDAPLSNTHRLFGTHMNTVVTYQDATVAYLSSDGFMSRIGSSVYTRFVGQSGTKVVRGHNEVKATNTKTADSKAVDTKAKDETTSNDNAVVTVDDDKAVTSSSGPIPSRPSALERQLSSLAGLAESKDEEKLAQEDAEKAQEQEMEDAREKDGEDQARRIDHLVLVTHGIGQRLGLRLDSINFVHDVNTLRKTIKAVYGTAPDLQALIKDSNNCTIQVLPICWRHLLDFPRQSLKQNRKEFDLGDSGLGIDDDYPSLQDITVEGVPTVRNLITDLAMDVLLYQSAYREHIASIVVQEANRVHKLFKQRTGFKGKVSLCGHSLGSAILFDILCRQESVTANRPRRASSRTNRDYYHHENTDVKLDFDCENFFALGSPIALFQMLKGRTIVGRQALNDRALVTSPFDPSPNQSNPFSHPAAKDIPIPITISSPKCAELYNIFHPTDPIAYRLEPLISPAMSQLKSQALPYVKKGLFGAPGLGNLTARMGQSITSSWYSLTSGVASTLINRSLGITGDEQALPQDRRPSPLQQTQTSSGTSGSTTISTSAPNVPMPLNDGTKQAELARRLTSPGPSTSHESSTTSQTLIDSEIETLFSGFQKLRLASTSTSTSTTTSTAPSTTTPAPSSDPTPLNLQEQNQDQKQDQDTDGTTTDQTDVRALRREEAKLLALNTNGRVDYNIQEGMFDVSLLASIASHLSYWADEDVNHFMISQMLKRGPVGGGDGDAAKGKGRDGHAEKDRWKKREEAML